MKIGTVIRKYRKEKRLTQEEMADCLGVSASAVNKWENHNSYPDITLLAPIARLLGITLDELLSFREDLSEQEIYTITEEINSRLKKAPLEEVYLQAKKKAEEFPSCYALLVQIAVILDADRLFHETELPEGFEDYVESLYRRGLESPEERVRLQAAEALLHYYIRQERYEEAETCLAFYSDQNPEKKRKQAHIYYETGQYEKAYKSYEEMLFAEYQQVSESLQGIYMLALRKQEMEKAHRIVEKQAALAELFDMGKYYEASCQLELSIVEKDEQKTLRLMKEMLDRLDEIFASRQSFLYEHMKFKDPDPEFLKELRENLTMCFADEETFGFLKDRPEWKQLMKDIPWKS